VPFGVLLALSTRLCLAPDRGVTLLPRKAETGDVNSSRSRGLLPLTFRVDSAVERRLSGVVSVGACCWGAAARVAIFGVKGGLFTARPTVGCRWPATDGRSDGGILTVVGSGFGVPVPGFTIRTAGVAFSFRARRGWRDPSRVFPVAVAVAVAVAGGGQAVAVVVIRAVLLPAAVVLVVKIPADGFFLRVFGGDRVGLPVAAAAW
jgi:hypothetical protein